MAGVSQAPRVDYFSIDKESSQNNESVSPPFIWDSNFYTDPALISSDSSGSTLTSPTSPESVDFHADSFDLSSGDTKDDLDSFNFGSFEDWMRWDDPTDSALSPTSNFFPELKMEPMSPEVGMRKFQGNDNRGPANTLDESAVFVEDPVTEPLFQTSEDLISSALNNAPPREGLYSTPLSWSRPTLGSRQATSYNGILTPEQEAKLRDIAMPPKTQTRSPSSPTPESSPEPCIENIKKRKSSVEEDYEEDSPSGSSSKRHPPIKKTAHNMIEKRYRTNLNDKIAVLRDSVPSLRVMSNRDSKGEEIEEDLQGLTPAHKLNKATVLSKATEYIAHLEKRNRDLKKENSSLKSRVDAFEILVMSRQPQNARTPSSSRQGNTSQYSLDGMIG